MSEIQKYSFEPLNQVLAERVAVNEPEQSANIINDNSAIAAQQAAQAANQNSFVTKEELERVKAEAFHAGVVQGKNEANKIVEQKNSQISAQELEAIQTNKLLLDNIATSLVKNAEILKAIPEQFSENVIKLSLAIARKITAKYLEENSVDEVRALVAKLLAVAPIDQKTIIIVNKTNEEALKKYINESLSAQQQELVELQFSEEVEKYSCKLIQGCFELFTSKEKLLQSIEQELGKI